MDLESIANLYIDRVAYSVGYDISDDRVRGQLLNIIESGIQDMYDSGVSEDVIKNNSLVLTTLIIFVTDNINMSAGEFKTSSMYITNIAKLRLRKNGSEQL